MYDVIAIGEMLIDFTTDSKQSDGYPIMAAHPGGAPANFLAPLAKYGKKTALMAKVGKDAFGEMLIATLDKFGIDTKFIKMSDEYFTTLAFVTHDETGDRQFSFARKPGADIALSGSDIDKKAISEARVIHFGTVGMTNDPSRSAHKAAIEYAKKCGKIISFDPNLREMLWDDIEKAKEAMLWGLSVSDIVKISDNEVEFLFGCTPEEGAKIILEKYGAKLVWVTLGAKGCYFANKNACGAIPIYEKVNVIDTTGAGDIFGGSAMFAFLNIGKAPDELSFDEMKSIAAFACKTASLSTTKLGGISSVPEL